MNVFPLNATDFYKVSHRMMFPPGTEMVYANFTCRSDKLARVLPDFDHKTVFFGLQGICQWLLKDTWDREFFEQPKAEVLSRYQRRMDGALGTGAVGIEHFAALHDLGYLPLLIKALPEGARVDIRVPCFTIRNTLPEFYWLPLYIETQLSAEIWKSVHSATIAHEYRRLLDRYAALTGSPKAFVPWQGHDFSARGMSGVHDAMSTGAAHLLSFTGTDTVSAIDYLEDYYGGRETFIGGSVPATEHSVMCMGGEDDEVETFRRLICDTYPSGIVSIVSDTWDFWRVICDYSNRLHPEIMGRSPDALGFAKVVFRPDSGDPVKVICGDMSMQHALSQLKTGDFNRAPLLGAVECLWENFGGTHTHTGHRLLDPHVGVIYGDSITLERANDILRGLYQKGFASGNIVFGIGSYTYQMCTRDSFGCAIKATFGRVNGEDRVLFKAPKTDDGIKNSARGLLRVEHEGGHFMLHEMQTWEQENAGALAPVFLDGALLRFDSLATIRERLLSGG